MAARADSNTFYSHLFDTGQAASFSERPRIASRAAIEENFQHPRSAGVLQRRHSI